MQGKNVGSDISCPNCRRAGTLYYTGCFVERGAVVFDADKGLDARRLDVPTSRCAVCKGRFRVLPCELLPFKSFSLPVIEDACCRYASPTGSGLRTTVEQMGKYAPAHSTLWRWLAGLGERAMDRGAAQEARVYRSLPSAAALVSESAKRLDKKLRNIWESRFDIPAWKYLSDKRREQLEGCARIMAAAHRLFSERPDSLTAWHCWLVEFFPDARRAIHVTAWAFPTGLVCTPLQLTHSRSNAVRSSAKWKKQQGDHNYEARSPP